MIDQLRALQDSAARLRRIAEPLGADELRAQAYPTEWTVADVLSHLGSGAVIARVRLDAAVADRAVPDDFAQSIWDEWNAKTPEAKAADGLAADRALLDRVESFTDEERARSRFSMGPMEFDLPGYLLLRLNEHALHTWDIEVSRDPSATLTPDAARLVVDNLGMIVRFAGKPTGVARDLHIRTTEPDRDFTLSLGEDAIVLTPCDDDHAPDLELPAEAFIRLVYGRLDPDHTPKVRGSADLDELRRAFPGV
ncbi:MAG: hypothetical protein JWL83_672 [Actinomycetia bacterium]|jgi:uncharacterized protein (TIGR03083 family)|nr:hypothetical protein [Actinomycetes bacterium]